MSNSINLKNLDRRQQIKLLKDPDAYETDERYAAADKSKNAVNKNFSTLLPSGSGASSGSSSGSGSQASKGPYASVGTPNYRYNKWEDTEAGAAAYQAYQDALANYSGLPGFSFSKADELDSTYDALKNYGDFSYDVNADELYQQYADQYARLGKQAMQDTMGQAAALTGGYGSSYAQTAANQAYLSYMQQLSDIVPELESQAYSRWQSGKDDLANLYSILLSDYDRERQLYSDNYDRTADALGLARNDYYDGMDAFYGEQDRYNGMLDSDFNNALALESAKYSQSNAEKNYELSDRELAMDEDKWSIERSAYEDIYGTSSYSTDDAYTTDASSDGEEKFSGTTYREARDYVKKNGGSTEDILTYTEWTSLKNSGSKDAAAANYGTYEEYLAEITEYLVTHRNSKGSK